MILYHGSFQEVSNPDLEHSRTNVDFGRGFYTTPIYAQAIKWSEKFKNRGCVKSSSKVDIGSGMFQIRI